MYIVILNGIYEGKRIKLNPGRYIFGRSADSDIVLSEDLYISGNHAELKYNKNGKVNIADMNSKNGTFLLGEEVTDHAQLNLGDIFRVDHTFIKLTRRSSERYFSDEKKHTGSKVKNTISEKLNKYLKISR